MNQPVTWAPSRFFVVLREANSGRFATSVEDHRLQRAAAHGHKWWEVDPTYLTILFLRKVGIAKELVRPKAWVEADGIRKALQTAL